MTEIGESLIKLIRDQIDDALFNLHTGLPAKVVSFNSTKQSCSVQPLLQRFFLNTDGVPEGFDCPILENVPVEYMNGGGWSLTFPLVVDDIVFLAFAERSIDRWLDAPSGTIVDPISNHKFDLSDAVARPGPRPRSSPIPGIPSGAMRLAKDDGSTVIELSASGVSVNGALVTLGAGVPHPGVHGDVLATMLAFVAAFATGLVAACTPPSGTLDKSAVLPLATALAALVPALAIPAGPAGLLSAKVVLE